MYMNGAQRISVATDNANYGTIFWFHSLTTNSAQESDMMSSDITTMTMTTTADKQMKRPGDQERGSQGTRNREVMKNQDGDALEGSRMVHVIKTIG